MKTHACYILVFFLSFACTAPKNTDESVSVAANISDASRNLNLDLEKARNDFSHGLEYVEQGKVEEGIALMRQSAASYDSIICMAKSDGSSAISHYDADQSGQDSPDISVLQEKSRRQKAITIAVIVSLIILFLVCSSLILLMRNRMLRYKRELGRRRIMDLNDSNNRMAERIDVLEHDLSVEMHSNNEILSSPQLITGKDEGKFRRAFNVLYPDFIKKLKMDYPTLSTNDELVCMLLYLHHTSEEISVYLGISRASVNSARYRLRTKFGLPKSIGLDTFISSR